jgi:hypothetical protein
MSERVQAYFEMLGNLTSEELGRSAEELAVREKQNVARLIAHIAEIGERGYHLEMGYKSLFDFSVRRLNLSEGSVYRRTQVAGVCKRFPEILEALSEGRLHLTAASLIAPHLTRDNVEDLIGTVQGKTRREIEQFLVTLAPKEVFESSVRRQGSPVTKTVGENAKTVAPEGDTAEQQQTQPAGETRTRDLLEPATEERFNFRFSAGKEFTEKFRRLAEVLGIESPHAHLEEIFEQALESALDKKDPKRKLERRRKREAKKEAARPGEAEKQTVETRSSNGTSGSGAGSPAVARGISSEVRERVLERAGYQCEYRGPEGDRCSSCTGLQVEHTKPFAIYRTHDEQYLRAFCPAHNLFAAEEYYGRQFIRQKIDAAGAERRERSEVQTT